ncbi:MAG: L,D-transpeptidase family protein [Geminicoccaceae bacterium]|nr:L,D-transpeptidase family protein [Geminicoccaceae bacterium]MCX8099871.1 L,D-transpeptidase family protein [Geminicoccaceae bacterium]MDW8371535.1 L,D-transpeptidase family protein [Geminicoccaceae bacterium]
MPTRRALLPLLASTLVAPASAVAGLPRVERVEVKKRARVLELIVEDRVVWSCRVALGRRPEGHKVREGDGRTPEGRYELSDFVPNSYYYKAIRISYPNEQDRERARRLGVRPGGDIMIHGLDPAIARQFRRDHWLFNWTRGCIAVTDEEMDILWASVVPGTPIDIHP